MSHGGGYHLDTHDYSGKHRDRVVPLSRDGTVLCQLAAVRRWLRRPRCVDHGSADCGAPPPTVCNGDEVGRGPGGRVG